MATAKKTFADHVKAYLTPSLLIGAIVGGALFWGRFETNMKEVTFDDSRQKIEVVDHTNSVPNEVENYKLAQQLILSVNKVDSVHKMQEVFTETTKKNSDDAIKSRAKRDSIGIEDSKKLSRIARDVETVNLRQQLLEKKFDSIKQ